MVGDHLGGCLEPLGDGARQDIQDEGFRLVPLGSERHEGGIALPSEQCEQGKGDGAGTDDVQRHHRAGEPRRDVCVREQDLADEARGHEDHDERSDPTDGPAYIEEDQRSKRSEDAP